MDPPVTMVSTSIYQSQQEWMASMPDRRANSATTHQPISGGNTQGMCC